MANPTTDPSAELRPDSMPRALAYMVGSGLCFALMGAMVKLAGDTPVTTKVFFRNLVTLAITSGVAWRVRCNPFGPTPYLRTLMLRAACGLGGVYFYFTALGGLKLADASLLNKTSPFFVAVLAVVILKEPFNRAVLPALLAAFLGAILVIKPSFDYTVLPALAGLVSGAFAGTAYVLVRSLKGHAQPNRIIFFFSLVSCVATLPFILIDPPNPTFGQWLALFGTGVFAAGGQYGLTFAYQYGPASRISIFTYPHVLFALLVGFVLWDERPDLLSLLGGAFIIGAAYWVHHSGLPTRPGKES